MADLTVQQIAATTGISENLVRKYLVILYREGKIQRTHSGVGRQFVYPENAPDLVVKLRDARMKNSQGQAVVPKTVKQHGAVWNPEKGLMDRLSALPVAPSQAPASCPCCGKTNGLVGGFCMTYRMNNGLR